MATGKSFEEAEPTVEEGRLLLNGNTLNDNNEVVNVVDSMTFA